MQVSTFLVTVLTDLLGGVVNEGFWFNFQQAVKEFSEHRRDSLTFQ